jgi:hypothetical protein
MSEPERQKQMAFKVWFPHPKSGEIQSFTFPIKPLAEMFTKTLPKGAKYEIEETVQVIAFVPREKRAKKSAAKLPANTGDKKLVGGTLAKTEKQTDPNARIRVSRDADNEEKLRAQIHNVLLRPETEYLVEYTGYVVSYPVEDGKVCKKSLDCMAEVELYTRNIPKNVLFATEAKKRSRLFASKPEAEAFAINLENPNVSENHEKRDAKIYAIGVFARSIGSDSEVVKAIFEKARADQKAHTSPHGFFDRKILKGKVGALNTEGKLESVCFYDGLDSRNFVDPGCWNTWSALFIAGYYSGEGVEHGKNAHKYELHIVEKYGECKKVAYNDFQAAENHGVRVLATAGMSQLRNLEVYIKTFDCNSEPDEEGNFPEIPSLRFPITHEYASAVSWRAQKRFGRGPRMHVNKTSGKLGFGPGKVSQSKAVFSHG